MSILTFVLFLAAGRVLIGLAPIVAAGLAMKLFGFPRGHDTATARLFARLFGVRDIGLGVLVAWAVVAAPELAGLAVVFNLAHDIVDALVIAVPLARRQGIDRAAGLSLAFALGGASLWFVALSLLG